MKTNELRIGNYVSNQTGSLENIPIGKPVKVEKVDRFCELYLPIPLTKDWLIKFGFNEENIESYYYYENFFRAEIGCRLYLCGTIGEDSCNMYIDEFNVLGEKQCVTLTEIKHVHQLQNLYFALTGEELTIK